VLAHLARHDGIQQGVLAEILEVEPITLTRLVDRLEQMGLVERQSHSTDRRIRLLRLTEAARPKLADIFAVGAVTRGEAMEGVSEEDRERLLDVLSSMKANLIGKSSAVVGERRASHG
jgi:DNA-binding MarR family transcriptional regulator